MEFLDKKKTTETFLHRDTEHCTVLYTLFYLISIYINSCKNQLSKLQVFWKICWGALKSFQHCGQIFIFQWNLLKEENLYIPVLYNFFWMFNVVFFFSKLNMFLRMINSTFSSTSVWYRHTWLSVNSCWVLFSFLQI